MAKDNEYPTSDVHPVQPVGATGTEHPTEDPLVELARIVNRNRQPGASAGADRVGNTDYFAGLEDMGRPDADVHSRSAETQYRQEPVFDDAPEQVHSELRELEPVGGVPSYPEAETADLQAYEPDPGYLDPLYENAGAEPVAEPMVPEAPAPDTQTTSGYFDLDIPDTRLDSGISLDLESNLTAELEDELLGAFRQSYAPEASGASSDVVSAAEPYAPEPLAYEQAAESGLPEADVSEAGVADANVDETEADYGFPGEQPVSYTQTAYAEGSLGQQPYEVSVAGSYADEETAAGHYGDDDVVAPRSDQPAEASRYGQDTYQAESPVSGETTRLDQSLEDDLFAALDSLTGPRVSTAQKPPEVEQFQTSFDRYARTEEKADREPAAEDIDDMAWPAAAAALPDAVDDETLPPPEGYDLDAVAKAMQESDPTLGSAGVLPPHPKAEKAAAPHPHGSRKGLYAAAAVLAVALVGGGAFFFMDGSAVIAGLEGPLKIYPEAQSEPDNPSSKLIYDRVGSNDDASRERLVLPETTEPAKLPPAPDGTSRPDPLVPGAPKKVRTLVVRPDGTIVSEPDAPETNTPRTVSTNTVTPTQPVSPGQVVPAPATPVAPDPVASPQTPAIVAAANTDGGSDTASQTGATSPEQVDVLSVLPKKKPAAPVQVARTTAQPAAPANGPLDLSAAPAQPAPATPQAAAPVAASTGGTIPAGTYVVQVTSQRSEEAARNAYSGLQRKYAGILGNRSAVIVAADIQDRGTFYRARIPMSSRDDALNLCESLQAAGGDCFVRRN